MQPTISACRRALCIAVLLYTRVAAQPAPLALWYASPAGSTWESALPLGNGRIAAMVYGNTGAEILQLNEHTLWSGSPHNNYNPKAPDSLALIRELLYQGKNKAAEKVANNAIISKGSHGQMFLPAGELRLQFPGHETATDYRRELNIATATATVDYRVGNTHFTRRAITSFPDEVIAVHLTASAARSISFTLSYKTVLPATFTSTSTNGRIALEGIGTSHEGVPGVIKYQVLTEIRSYGGKRSQTDTSLIISNADSATIFVSIATSFKNFRDASANAQELAAAHLDRAVRKSFAEIWRSHINAYQHYFNRVQLNVGADTHGDLPTDVRLKKFRTWHDPAFAALYFQYGRYLLISSSRPGGQPANLQGIWNNRVRPPWDSKYTININAVVRRLH